MFLLFRTVSALYPACSLKGNNLEDRVRKYLLLSSSSISVKLMLMCPNTGSGNWPAVAWRIHPSTLGTNCSSSTSCTCRFDPCSLLFEWQHCRNKVHYRVSHQIPQVHAQHYRRTIRVRGGLPVWPWRDAPWGQGEPAALPGGLCSQRLGLLEPLQSGEIRTLIRKQKLNCLAYCRYGNIKFL